MPGAEHHKMRQVNPTLDLILAGGNRKAMAKQVTPIRDLKGYLEPEQVERVIAAATNPRDKAYVSALAKTGMRISEVTKLKVTDIDFKGGTLTIIHLKERVRLKCPNCGELLG